MATSGLAVRFVVYGITGFACEYLFGQVAYRVMGRYLYTYPNSKLKTSTPWMIPAWGAVGLIFEGIGKALGA